MISHDAHRLTSGKIFPSLLKFAIPYLLANFLTALYGAADVLIVSFFATPASLAATSTGAQAVFLMMALANGLTLGSTVLIGQYFGAKREAETEKTIQTSFSLFLITSILASIIMAVFAFPITHLLETPKESFMETAHYIMICGGGLIFTFMYESISAVLRGLGDSKNPLKFIAISSMINVLLDILFIGFFNWGAVGAAVATIIAQACSIIIAIFYLRRKNFIFKFSRKSFQFHPRYAKKILQLGIPSAIQQIIIFASFTLMTAIVNKLGVIASAAVGITGKIDGFLILPSLAFSSAVAVMTAQNIGARKLKRSRQVFYTGFLTTVVIGLASFYLMYAHSEMLMKLITSHPEIIKAGSEFMVAYSPDALLLCLVFCLNGFLNGCGRTTFTMSNNLITSILFRIPLIVGAVNLFEIGFALPLATIPQITLALFYFYSGYWKKSVIAEHKNRIKKADKQEAI